MELGKQTDSVKAVFPMFNTVVFLGAIAITIAGFTSTFLDGYTVLGIPTVYVFPVLAIGLGVVTLNALLSYFRKEEIELYEHGLRYKEFEALYEGLVVRRNGVSESITFSYEGKKITFKDVAGLKEETIV